MFILFLSPPLQPQVHVSCLLIGGWQVSRPLIGPLHLTSARQAVTTSPPPVRAHACVTPNTLKYQKSIFYLIIEL